MAVRDSSRVAARLTWGAIPGTAVDDDTADLLAQGIGGFVLFSHNLRDPEQIRALVGDLRRRGRGRIRLSVDQEGGHVIRIAEPLTRFPSAMAIGATRSSQLAYRAALASGRELAALGIDTVLAPVLDLAREPLNPTIGARSYGSDAALVARLGAAALRGYRDAGVVAVPKHFPGHGRTPVDSHVGRPRVTGGLEALQRLDLVPFRAARRAPMMMAAHVVYEGLDDRLPGSMAPAVLSLARRELRYEGAIVTDAMVMAAATSDRSVGVAAVAALASGADVVMTLNGERRALPALAGAVANASVPAARVDEALHRLRALDATWGVPRRRLDPASLAAAHAEVAETIARRSLTLAWDRGLLPLGASTSVALVELPSPRRSPIEDETGNRERLANVLARRFGRLHAVFADSAPRRRAAVKAAERAEVVMVATRDAFTRPADVRLVARLAELGRPTILVALRSPTDLTLSPGIDTGIAVYSDVPATLAALADALPAGRTAFPGVLPMDLPLALPAAPEEPAA